MTSNFKSGDMALIVNSVCAENIGKTVRLVQFVPVGGEPKVDGKIYTPREHPTWIVESIDGAASLLSPRVTTGELMRISAGPCREVWLMPLRGDFAPEQQKAKEAEPCL
ncbi:hypothetical protein BK660_21810 [Pseudomonas brassicacearum]|uniref:Uncharacterized protein n=1 Tax=Pseudomonas brassicacearum TaxID=930166 RepID=A0A423HXI4_9PSED|nr:hypothetical protein [Pseudomonas brassicacearum]RON17929.1 hypothetical protein BK660_21810 [Pseudomonas brassicacearum]